MTFLTLLFPFIIACYLIYWHNILIPTNNEKLFLLLPKRQNFLCIENIWVDFHKLEGEIKGAHFKMLIQDNAIILLNRKNSKFSYSYVLVNNEFKDSELSKNVIYYGSIKKIVVEHSILRLTFLVRSKSIFNEFSRQENTDTIFSIDLGVNSETTKEALAKAKLII